MLIKLTNGVIYTTNLTHLQDIEHAQTLVDAFMSDSVDACLCVQSNGTINIKATAAPEAAKVLRYYRELLARTGGNA